jgi:hypothetical protein
VSVVTSVWAISGLLYANAPNPADCPHRDCGYYQVDEGSTVSVLAVIAVVALLLAAVAIVVIARRRRRDS